MMSFAEEFLKKLKPKKKQEVIERTISRQTIVDLVASFLYAASVVDDNKEITNIQFGELFGASDVEHVPMKIYMKEV